jgi:hypothetical protein
MPKFLVCKLDALCSGQIVFSCDTASEALAFTAEHVDDLSLEIYERQDNLIDLPGQSAGLTD